MKNDMISIGQYEEGTSLYFDCITEKFFIERGNINFVTQIIALLVFLGTYYLFNISSKLFNVEPSEIRILIVIVSEIVFGNFTLIGLYIWRRRRRYIILDSNNLVVEKK